MLIRRKVVLLGLLLVLSSVALPLLLLGGGLVGNRATLSGPPGFAERLKRFLNTNTAATSDSSDFPELETPRSILAPDAAYSRVVGAVENLGWEIVESNESERLLRAVVSTPLFRFRDDVTVRVLSGGDDIKGSAVQISSKSRVGKGDLGANRRHILDLRAELDRLGVTTPRNE